MLHSQFKVVFDEQQSRCEETLVRKAAEYQTDEDVLHNFKVAASLQHCDQMQALGGMLAKHVVSIYDMLDDPAVTTIPLWNEKITDAINYLYLLRAAVAEEFGETNA